MAYVDFKDFLRRKASDKVLRDKLLTFDIGFDIAKSKKNDWYQRGLSSMVYNFFYIKVFKYCCYICR